MRVLIVEDHFLVSEALRLTLLEAGHQVVGVAADAPKAVSLGREHSPDVALVDVHLAHGTNGIDAARTMHAECGIPSMFMTSDAEATRCARDIALGCLEKPYKDNSLLAALRAAEKMIRGQSASERVPGLELFTTRSL